MKNWEVMKAYEEGAKIEIRRECTREWVDLDHDGGLWDFSCNEYRVKPEPKKRLMTTFELAGKWIVSMRGNIVWEQVTKIDEIWIYMKILCFGNSEREYLSIENLHERGFKWADHPSEEPKSLMIEEGGE